MYHTCMHADRYIPDTTAIIGCVGVHLIIFFICIRSCKAVLDKPELIAGVQSFSKIMGKWHKQLFKNKENR